MSDMPATKMTAEFERERLVSLVNSMADGVIAVDDKEKVVLYNGAALNILDLNSSMQGKDLKDIVHIIDKKDQPIDITELVLSTKTQMTSRDYLLKYPDGSAINLYLSIAPVQLGFGKKGVGGYVMLLRDITREKSLEEERDEFISVISHELRTPIAIAEGNISNAQFLAIKGGNVPLSVLEALVQSEKQIEYLGSLINDLATLARAERGRLTVEVEAINAHQLVQELAENYEQEARKKNLELIVSLDPALELLNSSKLYVREILQNFITNAIKYTSEGKVTISAHQQAKGILFTISDTGIGISRQDQQKVFQKFFRSEDYRTRQNNGTGLGLYVTTKLAKLIQAEIKLESELNKGSTFSVFIPNIEKPQKIRADH